MVWKDHTKQKEYNTDYYKKNKEYIAERTAECNQHAYDSISTSEIVDKKEWDKWCSRIKTHAAQHNHPYSDDFMNDQIFNMMIRGCFYCGDIATTIVRIDSKLDHIPGNCVGSCIGCNKSKGAADPDTFIRKAYYRVRGEYYDDIVDIWFVNKKKPGIDRVVPSKGYVLGNIVSCCYDCNLDKLEDDVDTMMARNQRIVDRVDAGELVINDHEKMLLHNGTHGSSKKVCAYGEIYSSMAEASRALGKCYNYIAACIRDGRHVNDIFVISDEFYEECGN